MSGDQGEVAHFGKWKLTHIDYTWFGKSRTKALNADEAIPIRTKILLITRNFPPIIGGMERLNWHIAKELAQFCDVHVVGPKGPIALNGPSTIRITSVDTSPLATFFFRATLSGLNIATTWRPDIVIAGSGLTVPIAWLCARLCSARVFAYVHGLDLVVPNRIYKLAWLPFLRKADGIIANSKTTMGLAVRAGIKPDSIRVIHPGTKTPDVKLIDPSNVREKFNLGSGPILLSVGRLTRRKGILEFIENALPIIARNKPDCILVIVGDTPRTALFGEAVTSKMLLSTAEKLRLSSHIRHLPYVSDEALSELYLAASVHVFPVQDLPDNPEGFGMVAIEAAAHGLPTIAFASGGVPDAVIDGKTGVLVPPGDYESFATSVTTLLRYPWTQDQLNVCRTFAASFDWKRFGAELRGALSIPEP